MNPIVEQIRAGTAPTKIKEYAAEGLLPLPEDEKIPLQVLLTRDTDVHVSQIALATLRHVSEQVWTRLVDKKDPDEQVVSFCLQNKALAHSIREKILLNHSVPDRVIRDTAATESGPLLDLIISNHVRLLRDPEIFRALESNRSLTFDQRRRLEEFKLEFVLKKSRHEQAALRIEAASFEDILAQIPNLDAEAQRIIQEIDKTSQEAPSDEQVQQAIRNIFAVDDIQQIPEDTLTTYQRLLKMKPGEKIRLALLGTKEERAILIRDGSRQVSSMVLRSPKITDPEIEAWAQIGNLDSD